MTRGSDSPVGAILLAAGGSSRLGRPKQLVEIDGEPLVRRAAIRLLALQPACVVVVTGAHAPAVRSALDSLDVACVHNPDWKQGMGTSLACGIRAMPERVRGALLLLVDQYRVTAGDLRRLLDAWLADPLVAATAGQDGQRGPPVVFPRALFDRLARLRGDTGARHLLKKFRGRQILVPMPDASFDLDTVADLQDLNAR